MSRWILTTAGVSGALAVALGAMAAHALKDQLDAYSLEIYTKAATYHMYHALALFGVGILALHRPSKIIRVAAISFVIGIVLFSGSLYVLALTGIRQLGIITPFGGIAFIIGWLALAWSAFSSTRSHMLPIIVLFMLAAGIASAQTSPSLRLGVFGAYGGAQTDQVIPTLPDCECPEFNALAGSYWNGGIVVQIPFTTGDGINVGLLAQVGYHNAFLAETVQGDSLPSLDQDGNVVITTTEHRADITDRLLLLDLAVDLELSGITLNAGLSAGYRTEVRGQTLFALTGPPGVKFDPAIADQLGTPIDSVTIETSAWDTKAVDAFVISPYASLGYRFMIDDLSIDVAAETRLLWPAAIPSAKESMWTYGGIVRVMYAL